MLRRYGKENPQVPEISKATGMKLLKPAEVAERLSIDLSGVYRLVKEAKLASYRINSSVRISEDDLNDYLDGRRIKAINAFKPIKNLHP